jgi:S-methylmethionine-dependent homocysteine/selenocysteine methylase
MGGGYNRHPHGLLKEFAAVAAATTAAAAAFVGACCRVLTCS